VEPQPLRTGASRSGLTECNLAIPAARRMTTEGAHRWLAIYMQLLCMQRDIAQRKIQGPGSGKAR
jgi:hypothetical protein